MSWFRDKSTGKIIKILGLNIGIGVVDTMIIIKDHLDIPAEILE